MFRATAALAFLSVTTVYADTVVSATTSVAQPLTSYFYTVINAGPENIFEFTLFLRGPMLTNTVITPAGWSMSTSSTFVDWFAVDPNQQIVAGTSLGGFSFDSLQSPDLA